MDAGWTPTIGRYNRIELALTPKGLFAPPALFCNREHSGAVEAPVAPRFRQIASVSSPDEISTAFGKTTMTRTGRPDPFQNDGESPT